MTKRVMLIHALRDSVAPIHAAFAAGWAEAETHDLLDSSLAAGHAADSGRLGEKMTERFRALGHYAAAADRRGRERTPSSSPAPPSAQRSRR